MTDPHLTDRQSLRRARQRAHRASGGMAGFLHRTVADEFEERLKLVNRTFTSPAIVTGFPEIWGEFMPDAKQVEDTDILDLQPGAHDLVLHAMALHWANDPIGQLAQARYALKPDGLFLAAFLGGETLIELRHALAEAEVAELGGLSPRVAPMADIRAVGSLMQRAGLALPVAESMPLTVTYQTPFHLMRDLRAMGETNALAARNPVPARRSMFLRMAENYTKAHGTPDGRVSATFEILVLTGWAPDASQPQPLRPGSATTRLADALGTEEFRLPGDTSEIPD